MALLEERRLLLGARSPALGEAVPALRDARLGLRAQSLGLGEAVLALRDPRLGLRARSPALGERSLGRGEPGLRFVYQLNPMTGVMQGFRWAWLGNGEAPGMTFLLSVGIILLALAGGAFVFRRTERTVVDIL